MDFVVVGLDHTTAGIELRERLAFAEAEIPAALQRLTCGANSLLDQAAILSTCNRVELYGVARSPHTERGLISFLALYHGLATAEVAGGMYAYRGDQVPHHLAATAAGIHSLVLGEAQIQGQIRKALELALAAGTAGPELRRMFESAIAAGRLVRCRTAIGRGAASVPYAGVEFARCRLGTLSQSVVLLIGTGSMGELAAKYLVKRGMKQLLVLGRVPTRTNRFAESYGANAITHDQLDDALAQADVVIAATGTPQPVVHRNQLCHAVARRSGRSTPLLLIDLSVPRAIDPAAADLSGVEIHTTDELEGVVERTLMQRHAALSEAQEILRAEVARFTEWLHRRETAQSNRLGCSPRQTRALTGAKSHSGARS